MNNCEKRLEIIKNTKRLVIKVGSRLLADNDLNPCQERIDLLIKEIASIKKLGIEVILVSSGAIGAGMSILQLTKRPKQIEMLQTCASVGQTKLISMYEKASSHWGFHTGQILLNRDALDNRKRHINFMNGLNKMLQKNILPIINENDALSGEEEICFGENDNLAALVSSIVRAELTLLLTSVNGMYELTKDGEFGKRISIVKNLNNDIIAMAKNTNGNSLSTGGMKTKLKAASIIQSIGENLWIIDGRDFSVLQKIFKGEDYGTLFIGNKKKMKSQKRWVAHFQTSNGKLNLDDGAVQALKTGSSLLTMGITCCVGQFKKGDIVDIYDIYGEPIGRGITSYSTTAINTQIKNKERGEVIHRDNLVIF